jgi:hypothetical protein
MTATKALQLGDKKGAGTVCALDGSAAVYPGAWVSPFRPVLTRTTGGWSTGWTEEQRNFFTPCALNTIMTGETTLSMVEATELAFHFCGEGRERPQPHINGKGSIAGFVFNVYPRMHYMKRTITKHRPDLAAEFDELKSSEQFKHLKLVQKIEAPVDLGAVELACSAVNRLLVERFGCNIVVHPLTQTAVVTEEMSIKTSLKPTKCRSTAIVSAL